MCMKLETGQVGVELFGSHRLVKDGETVKRTGEIVMLPSLLHDLIKFLRWTFLLDQRCLVV